MIQHIHLSGKMSKMQSHIRLLLVFSLASLVLTACEQTMHVFAEGGLNIREAPGGSIVATIPPGHTVTVIEEGTEELEIGGRRGAWHRVRYGELEGYVFSAFLTEDEKLIAQLKMCDMVGGQWTRNRAYDLYECRWGWIQDFRGIALNDCGGVGFEYLPDGRVEFGHMLTGYQGAVGKWRVELNRIRVELSTPSSAVNGGGHYQSYPAIHYVEHHEGLIRYVSPEGDVLWQESTAEEIADRNIFCG
ncbi:MAG: SH3 domain-containing protein [Leptospiraceae bacterium]|nr:SH3 domain-containing protein [Leptospiraceae bacterium]